jgi:broad specificity phosphatase PhoE
MTMTRVLLIRHGETDWNASGRWQGRAPVPLNAVGLGQAERLGRYLASNGFRIDAVYSSDLKRAMQTAVAVTTPLKLDIHPEPRLREIDLGDWQGLTRDEAAAWDAERYAIYHADRQATPIPNGESWDQVKVRVRGVFDDLAARHRGQTIALISHGGTIGRLLESLYGHIDRPSLSNTSITILEQAAPDAAWNLARVSWSPHLLADTPLGETW